MTQYEIEDIVAQHQKWLEDIDSGKRTSFTRASFTNQDLNCKNLSGVLLRQAYFTEARLKYTLFNDANLQGADFTGANLFGASLINANLQGADFTGANLFDANLSGANLENVTVNYNTQGYFLACPSGAFTAFKKAGGYIVVLEIPADAQRSSATTYKCRCDKAKVLRIENLDGTPADVDSVASNYDKDFIYKVGETVSVENFDDDRWNECSTGIHFFIDRDLAVIY